MHLCISCIAWILTVVYSVSYCLPTFLLSVLDNVTEYIQLCGIQDHMLS